MARIGTVKRVTGETQIEVTINLDGQGKAEVNTGVGFFDHMLNNFARHGLFDLTVKATGDLYVDSPLNRGYRNCIRTGNFTGCWRQSRN